ncbi:MAG: hypothetical protein H6739_02540 [Alphaproteobacteria bacterium]|nr:hypothetical protein [Alphaproteobacteria bacterium]
MSRSKIAHYGLLSGLCPLIPLPFVDEWVLRRVRAALFVELLQAQGVSEAGANADTLSEDTRAFFPGCLWGAFLYPIRKLFRTVLFFLLIKDCLDQATETLHRGQMVLLAAERGLLPAHTAEVRAHMDQACRDQSISPINRFLLRKQRPALPDRLHGERLDPLSGLAAWLQAEGGGGIVIPAFDALLDTIETAPEA